MLDSIIRFSLRHRMFVAAAAMLLLCYGGWEMTRLPIDVFPDLNRPRVTVLAEAPGMATEEVEALITFPLEAALNGAAGVLTVRSSSGPGLSVIYVEFDWGTNILDDRQIVAEKLAQATDRLPEGVAPHLAPISSLMGQIMLIGMWSEGDKTPAMELRTLADWDVRPRLLKVPGVSQVFTMGGGRRQFQVLVDADSLLSYGVTLHDVETALMESNVNVTGGHLVQQGPNEILVRSLGRIRSVDDLRKLVIKSRPERPVLLHQVARVIAAPQVKRGDSAAFVREATGHFAGGPAVVLTINKQPGADTIQLTEEVEEAIGQVRRTLPNDIRIEPQLYQHKKFIELAIENVTASLRDGGILVVIVLFLFLLNFRTTFITLTAIPLSIFVTVLVFQWFGLSINTMTLGGLAVAIGELVDDAIVDMENIFRRLGENRAAGSPKPPLLVVFQASCEVRKSIVFGTLIVVLVFIPLFALGGLEGRLFTPLSIAYIVSIFSSLLVSLTVTPVLSYWLLPGAPSLGHAHDGFLLGRLKKIAGRVIGLSLDAPMPILLGTAVAVLVSLVMLLRLERGFLPAFNEGAVQINVLLPPGTSLAQSNTIAGQVEEQLRGIDDITALVRKTGRAELDEHAEGVNTSEIIARLDPNSRRSREEILETIRAALDRSNLPGVTTSVEQPLAHMISHMLSGVKSQIAVKLYGDDLDVLRRGIRRMEAAVRDVPNVKDLFVEPQVTIPQLRIEMDREQLEIYGLQPGAVLHFVETAMQGRVVSQVLDGQRSFDLLLRMDERYREDLNSLERLSLELPGGGTVPLASVAKIYRSNGPTTINREGVRRRVVLQCNTSGRGLVDVVRDMQARIEPIERELEMGYFIEYGGQFESQQSASRMILGMSIISVAIMFLVLFSMFGSANFALQVLVALPTAMIGAVAALVLTGQTLTVASMVGFISLCGIASRNGILLINHYVHLVKLEGQTWSRQMIVRAGQERLAPVLMTALTSGIGLVPLALAAGQPGKEILYPVATVIIGGLISSTLLEFFVRPALFWKFGLPAGQRVIDQSDHDIPLEQEETTSAGRTAPITH